MCHNSVPTSTKLYLSMPTSRLSSKVGRRKSADKQQSVLVLLFVGGNYRELESALRKHGYTVIVPSTADQAVALCPHNRIIAALVDKRSLAETDNWSLAQSLKMVSGNVPVLLLVPDSDPKQENLPDGVDWAVSYRLPSQVLNALQQYRESAEERAG